MPVAKRPTMREAFASSRTLIFGHRGAMADTPMNTLSSFQAAVDQGADGVELDVHLSQDGHIVVVHDFAVDATTEGRGDVADITLAELKRLDAGSWFSDEFAGERIPTLDEVFEGFADKLFFNVELKSRFDARPDLESAVADCIRRYGMAERTLVSSFDARLLQRFREICPEVMMGYLHGPDVADMMNEVPHEARHPWHDFIDEAYMRWARAAGYFVNAWTVNDGERARALRDKGVNGIITDTPAKLIAALNQC